MLDYWNRMDYNGQQHIEKPWLHSDIKNMAYYYVYPAFINIVGGYMVTTVNYHSSGSL